MIERMIKKVSQHLPLKILQASWDGKAFHLYGSDWSFSALSAWRISTNEKLVLGCYDDGSKEEISILLKDLEIVEIQIQETLLRIDPIFVLSNHQKIEIFSIETYEPWTFEVSGLGLDVGVYVASTQEPKDFNSKRDH
ncbi:MAG: hypothetical protein BGO14_00800 [Chlamydiales bacterium 38-26]|nr:MAG: hypothetical protein BGO14_00800 [Chlamydiales bacterium 38-26]